MVLRYHGLNLGDSRIRRTLQTNDIGTPFFNIRLLDKIGISVEYAESGDLDVLLASLDSNNPPICAINTIRFGYWSVPVQHAVVVVAIEADNVSLNDPYYADQRQQVTLDEFLLAWAEHDYQYAILRPR